MNINDFILNVPQILPELLNNFCVVNKQLMNLKEIEKMGYDEFCFNSRINVPLKLYKYFPNREEKLGDGKNINYSLEALRNNTVFMQSPSNFDDVYDSEVNLEWNEFHKQRLIEYCKRSGIKVDENGTTEKIEKDFIKNVIQSFETYNNFEHIFTVKAESELKEKSNKLFQSRLECEFRKNQDLGKSIIQIIREEYENYANELKNTFKVSCFTTEPFSQLMWSRIC